MNNDAENKEITPDLLFEKLDPMYPDSIKINPHTKEK